MRKLTLDDIGYDIQTIPIKWSPRDNHWWYKLNAETPWQPYYWETKPDWEGWPAIREQELKNRQAKLYESRKQRDARRKKVFNKTNGMCANCVINEADHIDHKLAKCFGGTNEIENLQPLCYRCHKDKTSNDMQLAWMLGVIGWHLFPKRR